MKLRLGLLLFGLLLTFPASIFAQEVYLSVSGRNVRVASGDPVGQYDFWIRPLQGTGTQNPIRIEVYDAALGGFSDLIFDGPNTPTTYSLFDADALYDITPQSIRAANRSSEASASVTVLNETRYENRWVSMFQTEEASGNGWILRVAAGEGNDVNNFRIRVTGEQADQWQLVALDLSFGLIEVPFADRLLLRPLFSGQRPPQLTVAGEEETEVFIIDAFGTRIDAARSTEFNWQPTRYGQANSWGIGTSGSRQRINNVVIKGSDELFPVIFEPQLLKSDAIAEPRITTMPGPSCDIYSMGIDFRGFELDPEQAIWSLDNTTLNGREITHRFSRFGDVPYEVVIPTRGRYFPRYTIQRGTIRVNQAPQIVLVGHKSIISPSEVLTLDASGSSDPDGSGLEFQWFVNEEFRSSNAVFSFSSLISGRYDIRLRISDNTPNAGCPVTEQRYRVVVNTQPYTEIERKDVIARNTPETVRVLNWQDSDGDELVYRWSGAGIISDVNGPEVTVSHDVPGVYEITVIADDQSGTRNATYTARTTYIVNADPILIFTLPEIVAPNQPIVLNGRSSRDPAGLPLLYSWQVSDGQSFFGATDTLRIQTPGDYRVTLTVDDQQNVQNSRQLLSRDIRINAAPVPVIVAEAAAHNALVTFSSEGSVDTDQGIQEYLWEFGDGSVASGSRITHLYAAPGNYMVTLIVNDGMGLNNSIQRTTTRITINAAPIASLSFPSLVAPGQLFEIDGRNSTDADGQISTWQWSINNLPVGEGALIQTQITNPGIHEIRLQVKDNSGFDQAYDIATGTIRVNHAPVPRWTTTPRVTEPGVATIFSAAGSFDLDNSQLSFSWRFDDGQEFTGQRVTRSFTQPGTYTFTLSADDGEGLSNSVTTVPGQIRVNQSPVIVTRELIRSNTMQIALDASESYDADGNALRYTWVLPDGTRRTEPSFTWTAPGPGTHRIGLSIDDGEGLGNSVVSLPVEILVNRAPVAIVDASIEACSGQIIIFSSSRSFDPDGDNFTTHWDFGDGTTSRDSNPYHTYARPGFYTVTLTLNDGLAPEPTVAIIPVKIEGSPQAIMNYTEVTVCANSPVTFSGLASIDPNGPIGAYSWDFGDGDNGLGPQTTHLYSKPGVYDVVLTVIGSGSGNCSNISQVSAKVTVIEGPQVNFTIPAIVSPGQRISLDGRASEYEGNLSSATWRVTRSDSLIAEINGLSSEYTPREPGSYMVSLTLCTDAEGNCSSSVLQKVLQVNAAPQIAWSVPEAVAQHDMILLSAAGSIDPDGYLSTIDWTLNGNSIGSGMSVFLPTGVSGKFNLALTITDNSGVSNASATLRRDVIINAAPEPWFNVPDLVHSGETIVLVAETTRDRDGHTLTSTWVVNGDTLNELRFTADLERYEITLIQDDSQELPNSVKAVTRVIQVKQPEPFVLSAPSRIVRSSRISAEIAGLPASYRILSGAEQVSHWTPTGSGLRYFTYAWAPAGSVLKQYNSPVVVLDDLAFDQQSISMNIGWNAANPFIEVQAPTLNRDVSEPHLLVWTQNGRIVGHGKSVKLRIQEGVNRFELQASDQQVFGSTPIRIPVEIIARNP